MMSSSHDNDPEVGAAAAVSSTDPPEPITNSVSPRSGGGGVNKKKLLVGSFVVACAAALCIGIAVPISNRNKREQQQNTSGSSAYSSSKASPNVEGGSADASVAATNNDNGPDLGSTGAAGGGDGTFAARANPNRFDAPLKPFDSSVMDPYGSCDELRADIENALRQLANSVIEANEDRDCRWWYEPFADTSAPVAGAAPDSAQQQDRNKRPSNSAADVADGGGEDSYETNNQVEGVDEGDMVKSDGSNVFAGYGSELIMLDLNGTIVDRITVPTPRSDETNGSQDSDGAENEDEVEDEAPTEEAMMTARTSFIRPPYRKPTRTIRSLLLDKEHRLVTAITHYQSWTYYRNPKIISGGSTTAFIYEYGSGKLVSQGSVDIPGRFASARSVDSHAHIISNANINTYYFTGPLYRCRSEFQDMTDDEYAQAALDRAGSAVTDYAEKIMSEIRWGSGDNGCEHIVRISSMSEEDDEAPDVKTERRLDLTNGRGILNSFVQITSFDTSMGALGALESNVHVAGCFVPTSAAETYASRDFIVLAGQGYRQSSADSSWSQYTFLMSFDLQDGKAVQSAVGEVKGYLLNQFSMDYHKGELRVATTNRAKWAPVPVGDTGSRRWQIVSDSSSQVAKFRFVDGRMVPSGLLEGLGVTERIFACRFMGDRAYVVTFQRKDPLYVIDMNPTDGSGDPKVLGELNITGFSSYIHPIGDNDEYLLTVGQEADPKTGRSTGMKISLFDVSDPTDPTEVQKYVVNENKGYSSTAAQWDHHAFRYLDRSKKLILPVSIYRYKSRDNFDGFVIYDVDIEEGIEPVGNVTHADSNLINSGRDWYCFGYASLPSRSMVFAGDLMTFKGHSIKMSKGLTTLDPEWLTNLDEGRNKDNDVCYGYFPWMRF